MSTDLNSAFAALADPTRRAILSRLALGETTIMELAAPFDMTQPTISHHIKVLEKAGLIVRRIEGTRRPIRLAPGAIDTIDLWLAKLRPALACNYERLDEVLTEIEPQRPTPKKRKDRR